MKTVKIKFYSYADVFPEVFLNSTLRQFSKNIAYISIHGKKFLILENKEEIINECNRILSRKENFVKRPNTFVNMFNFYFEKGCKDIETFNKIEHFHNFITKQHKTTSIQSVAELLTNEKVRKFAYNVKPIYSFICRNRVKPNQLFYLPIFDLLLDDSINKYDEVINIYYNDYDWIVKTYLPVIEYLENNGPRINLQSYFYQIEILQEEKEQKNLPVLLNLYIGMDEKGKLYPFYNLSLKTLRLYTRQPNIQGLSKNIENEIFDFANLQRFDFPNFDISIIAYLTGDIKLNNLLSRGYDIYYYLLSIKLKKHYSDIIKMKDTEEMKRLRQDMKDKFIKSIYSLYETDFLFSFPQLINWKKKILTEYEQTGKTFAYFCKYRKVEKPEQAINYPIQCFGANVAVYTCKKLIDNGYNVKLFKHDEFVVDDDKKLPQLKVQEIIEEIEQTRPF